MTQFLLRAEDWIKLTDPKALDQLLSALRSCGIRAVDPRIQGELNGFPLGLSLHDGGSIVLELPEPAMLGTMDPDVFGVAALDSLGYTRRAWGLAKRLKYFRTGESALLTELGPAIQSAYEGIHSSLYYDGYRFYISAVETDGPKGVLVISTYAGDEKAPSQPLFSRSRRAEENRARAQHEPVASAAVLCGGARNLVGWRIGGGPALDYSP